MILSQEKFKQLEADNAALRQRLARLVEKAKEAFNGAMEDGNHEPNCEAIKRTRCGDYWIEKDKCDCYVKHLGEAIAAAEEDK